MPQSDLEYSISRTWILRGLYTNVSSEETNCQDLVVHAVILATQKAEIRRLMIQCQPGIIVHETLSQKNHHKKGLAEWLKV
jgi:hypothetical protein